jgi:hypothetical protein
MYLVPLSSALSQVSLGSTYRLTVTVRQCRRILKGDDIVQAGDQKGVHNIPSYDIK